MVRTPGKLEGRRSLADMPAPKGEESRSVGQTGSLATRKCSNSLRWSRGPRFESDPGPGVGELDETDPQRSRIGYSDTDDHTDAVTGRGWCYHCRRELRILTRRQQAQK
jgi:hypothetical protein